MLSTQPTMQVNIQQQLLKLADAMSWMLLHVI